MAASNELALDHVGTLRASRFVRLLLDASRSLDRHLRRLGLGLSRALVRRHIEVAESLSTLLHSVLDLGKHGLCIERARCGMGCGRPAIRLALSRQGRLAARVS